MIGALFFLCYFYQMIYTLIPFVCKKRKKGKNTAEKKEPAFHRFAVMIAARNEEAVIGQLIESIQNQNYPSEYVDIFVAADNCTDGTAELCRRAGATVWERENKFQIGKGYALQFLAENIIKRCPKDYYDGYFIFDADNLLDENYISEMNAAFSSGARIVTGCRNSKNFGSSWISAGYGIWFLRESQFLNAAREKLGVSSVILGTGFLFHKDIIVRERGWNYLLMSEDMQFTVDNVLKGETIHYCRSAVLYDEQPTCFSQSFKQRARWVKGYLQVFSRYGVALAKEIIFKRSFSCYDISMSILPAMFLTVINVIANAVAIVFELINNELTAEALILPALSGLASSYLLFLLIGALTVISERRQIHCTGVKLLLYTLSFPIYMLTYIPIAVYAIFNKVKWTPIEHKHSLTLDEIRQSQ